jgi:hypothetical protein
VDASCSNSPLCSRSLVDPQKGRGKELGMEAQGAGSSGTRVVFSVSDTTTGFSQPQQKSKAAAEVERDEIVWHCDEETVGEGVGAGGLLDLSEAEDGDIDVEGIANRLGLPTSFQSGKEATAKRKKERKKKAGKVRSAPEKSQVNNIPIRPHASSTPSPITCAQHLLGISRSDASG